MDQPISPTMAHSLELLEEKFRRVEQESERRVLDESDELSQTGERKYRKRPAVSVSQFGKQQGQQDDDAQSPASSTLCAAASRSTFYHTLAHPRSVDSFVSDNSEQETHSEPEQHEIRVERIAGRQSIPKSMGTLLPRRLMSAHSQLDYVSSNRGMVIDISVETTMELSRSSPDLHASTVYATRPRAGTTGIVTSHGSLVERAKVLARKLRRKSRTELP